MASIYFLPNYFQNKNLINSASARYRAIWPSENMNNSILWDSKDNIRKMIDNFECLFLQKLCSPEVHEIAKYAKSVGKLVILDLTDPIWFSNQYFLAMSKDISLFTVSSPGLKDELAKLKLNIPIYIVEDGEDLSHYSVRKKNYEFVQTKPTLSWTGMKDTYPNLIYALEVLKPLEGEINIKVIADEPLDYNFKNLEFIKWSLEVANKNIIDSDIFINSRDPKIERNKLKSNNKSNLAWALGLPVIHQWDDGREVLEKLKLLLSDKNIRKKNAQEGFNKVRYFYNIERVVSDLRIISDFHLNKNSFINFQMYNLKKRYNSLKYSF